MSYQIPVGNADLSRAASMNLIFDRDSIEFFPFDKVQESAKILFAGCGNGVLVIEIAKKLKDRNVKIVAFDNNEEQLNCARAEAEKEQVCDIEWKQHDICALDEYKGAFDIVHVRFVLNNVANAKQAIQELCKAVTENGLFIGEELSGCGVTTACHKIGHAEVMRAWEQGIQLLHINQGSDISFAKRIPKILIKERFTIENQRKPSPVAYTSAQKNAFSTGFSAIAKKTFSNFYYPSLSAIEEKLKQICECNDCIITIPHFTQILASKQAVAEESARI